MKEKVLLIAPVFFGYYKEIIKELEETYEIDYIADIPSNKNIYKAITRVNRNFGKIFVKKYFKEKIKPLITTKQYDYCFVVVGMTFSFFPEMFEEIKKCQEKAKFILYQWDGEENLKFIKAFHKFFDDIYTFDRLDAKNKIYKFLPLFYIDKYKKAGENIVKNYKYDVSYIGTAHPQKIKKISEMSNKLKKVYSEQFIYNYMPSKLKYYYHKLKTKEYKNVKIKDLKFEKLSSEETMGIFRDSKCILDVPQKGQNGLTIRTIECLGAKRKLITTNKDIVNYDFYCPENIYIYDGEIDYNSIFFKSNFKELEIDIYEKYSLKNWLKIILKK